MNSHELEQHLTECLPDGGRIGDVRARIESKFPKNPASTALVSLAVARMLIADIHFHLKGQDGVNSDDLTRQVCAHRFVDLWAEYISNRRLVAESLIAPGAELLAIASRKLAQLNRSLLDELSRRKGYAAMAPVGDFLRDISG